MSGREAQGEDGRMGVMCSISEQNATVHRPGQNWVCTYITTYPQSPDVRVMSCNIKTAMKIESTNKGVNLSFCESV